MRNMETIALTFAMTVLALAPAGCSENKEGIKREPSASGITFGREAAESVTTPNEKPPSVASCPTSESSAELPSDGRVPTSWSCPPKTRGAKMVLIPDEEVRPFCIDEREAVNGEYAEFVAERGDDFSCQPPECAGNKDWSPAEEIPDLADLPPIFCMPPLAQAAPGRAMDCLNFCQAWAFCTWAGKRLCGLRGAESGKVNVITDGTVESGHAAWELVRTTQSEWVHVCTQGGATKFPYGDEYESDRCIRVHTADDSALDTRDTSGKECHGTYAPYDQVYNMSGNAYEWLNICVFEFPLCIMASGSKYNIPDNSCAGIATETSPGYVAGVRCCADAVPGFGDE